MESGQGAGIKVAGAYPTYSRKGNLEFKQENGRIPSLATDEPTGRYRRPARLLLSLADVPDRLRRSRLDAKAFSVYGTVDHAPSPNRKEADDD